MMRLLSGAASFLALASFLCAAPPEPDTNQAFDHFYNLEYDETVETLRALVQAKPNSAAFHNELAQVLLYREMFRSGNLDSELATGDAPLLERPKLTLTDDLLHEIEASIEAAMRLSAASLLFNPKDTEALFELGVAYAARANVRFFVQKSWFGGLRDVAKSRSLHDRVVELDPAFADAALTQGAHDYVISQLPLAYKVVGAVAGFRGNRTRGIETIARVAREGKRRRVTAQMLLAVIYRREKQPELAVPLLAALAKQFPRNYLFPIELAQMHAESGDLQASMLTLRTVEQNIADRAPGFNRISKPRVDFIRGHIQFRHGLLDQATSTLLAVAAGPDTSDPDTRALAWLRLGQIRDIRDQRDDARTAYEQATLAAPLSEAARLARLFLLSPYRSDVEE